MKVYVGADHNGYALKSSLVSYLSRSGYEVVDLGDDHFDPEDDFPTYAQKVAVSVLGSEDTGARGILLCGSGQGVCIAANRMKGIRAALGYNRESVRSSRNDDDVNVLCLPARELDKTEMYVLAETFLNTKFAAAPRYIRRIKQLDQM